MLGAKPPVIFFSVGEPSGDLHGANLIRQLQARNPGLRAVGYGGPKMAAAGCTLHADLTALAVMWFGRALFHLHKFLDLGSRADRFFRHHRPDAVVLIDYPGFNWWIARRAKAHGIPVFYYTPPQVWAWARWRVHKLRRLTDHVLCSLPFEEPWFRKYGCNTTFVGHPFFDEVRSHETDESFLAAQESLSRPLVVIFPGSRTQEVTGNFQTFLDAAEKIRQAVPETRFAVACFKRRQAEFCKTLAAGSGLKIEVHCGKTPELMRAADCCMAVSGSISLELLYHTKPTVILYKISRPAFVVQSFFRKVKYITLVNLLVTDEFFPTDTKPFDPLQSDADKVLFPEYLTWEDKSQQIADHVVEWLTHPEQRRAIEARLAELKAQVGHGGASSHAADYILHALSQRPGGTGDWLVTNRLLPRAAPLSRRAG